MATANCKKDLDGSAVRVHLRKVMSMVRKTERNAMRAAFAANRDRLFGGQHRCARTLWTLVGSISSACGSKGLEPQQLSDWRGG